MSKQWHVQQSTAEQLYEQTPDETVQLIWTDPPFGTDQLQVHLPLPRTHGPRTETPSDHP